MYPIHISGRILNRFSKDIGLMDNVLTPLFAELLMVSIVQYPSPLSPLFLSSLISPPRPSHSHFSLSTHSISFPPHSPTPFFSLHLLYFPSTLTASTSFYSSHRHGSSGQSMDGNSHSRPYRLLLLSLQVLHNHFQGSKAIGGCW